MITKSRVEEVCERDGSDPEAMWRVAVIAQIATVVVLAPSIVVPIAFTMHLLGEMQTTMGTLVALSPLSALLFPATIVVLFRAMQG